MPHSPCAIVGCPNDALPGRLRCRDHHSTAAARTDACRPGARARGYDRRWERRTRPAHLRMHPNCTCTACPSCYRAGPGGRCLRPATDVDHLDGLGPNGPRGHDHDNLQSLCHPCHSHRTARDQGPLT